MPHATLEKTTIDGLEVAYRDEGSGPPVLLLHGWPTSSHLWREVVPAIAERNRVIAPDLPGFGASAKPLDRRYDFDLFEAVVDGLLTELGIERVALGVHDLGGPIGVHWGIENPDRVTRLAILNTLLYPDFDEQTLEFVATLSDPDKQDRLTSPRGIEGVIRLGLHDESRLTDDALSGYTDPFAGEEARRALAAAGTQLDPRRFAEIAVALPALRFPIRLVYGKHDEVLPEMGETAIRLEKDLPSVEVTALPLGHFLQEEAPDEVAGLLAEFFAADDAG